MNQRQPHGSLCCLSTVSIRAGTLCVVIWGKIKPCCVYRHIHDQEKKTMGLPGDDDDHDDHDHDDDDAAAAAAAAAAAGAAGAAAGAAAGGGGA